MSGSHLFMVTPDSAGPARCRGVITELILRCARGDQGALGQLYDLLAPVVLGVLAHGNPSGPTEEETVRAFRRLWLRASAYDPESGDAVSWILEQVRDVRAECLTAS